jgi:CRP-like cAMP-binding protein
MDVPITKSSSRYSKDKQESRSIPAFCPTIQDGAEFIPNLPTIEYVSPGEFIGKQDGKCTEVKLIQSGVVKLTYLDENGQEFLLGLRSTGWWMGSMQSLLDVPNLYTVQAVTSCSLSTIPADDFSRMLVINPRMLRHFLSSICRENVIQAKGQIMLLASDAENRLLQMLDERENSVWKTLDPTTIMRQGDIAKLLAVSPEHLSRVLHRGPSPKQGGPSIALKEDSRDDGVLSYSGRLHQLPT